MSDKSGMGRSLGKGAKEALNSRARDRQKDKIKTIRERGKGQDSKSEPKESSSKREGCNRKTQRRGGFQERRGEGEEAERKRKQRRIGLLFFKKKQHPKGGRLS